MESNDKRSVSRIKETKLDKEIEKTDEASVILMYFIFFLCILVAFGIMYLLYIMAINNSL